MTNISLSTCLLMTDIQGWANRIEAHRPEVFLLSFTIVGFTSFLMWLAYRRIKSEKWMFYFSWAFGLLAMLYFVLLIPWYAAEHEKFLNRAPGQAAESFLSPHLIFVAVQLLSVSNNLFWVAAARDIENRKPVLPRWAWLLAGGALLTLAAGYAPRVEWVSVRLGLKYEDHALYYETLKRSVDSIFSALTLFLVGRAIFSNISVRRHAVIAVGSIVGAVVYGALQLTGGLVPLIAEFFVEGDNFMKKMGLVESVLRGIALPLKIVLCVSAYFLVMRFFETLHEVRRLQDSGIDKRQDYLSSDGVVKLVGEKLTDVSEGSDEGGFVNVVVKLPGEYYRRLACIVWPDPSDEKRVKILDWVGPSEFSPLTPAGEGGGAAESPEWEKCLRFVEKVLTREDCKTIIWSKEGEERGDVPYAGGMKSIVSVVIEAHGAAIGCLQVARSNFNFSQMAIRQISEIANLISPSVQAHRELAALDHMSIRFAEKQAEEKPYPPDSATAVISNIIHDVFAPVVTRFHMSFGFFSQEPVYLLREQGQSHYTDRLAKKMRDELEGREWKHNPPHITSDGVVYNILKKQLTARVRETRSVDLSEAPDRFITGNLILAVNDARDRYQEAALGGTYLHRKAASTLASDAYLDFARDYYNELLKTLGERLSQNLKTMDEWFVPVNEILKKEARLSWVVAGQKGRPERLGDVEALPALDLLPRDGPGWGVTTIGDIRIAHRPLPERCLNASHVLNLRLRASEASVWLGVERPQFGPELEFSSPWRTFLVNFTHVADAALARITFPEKFQLQLEAAQLQGIISAVVTTETVMHQLSNSIQVQSSSMSTLLEALKLQKLRAEEEDLEQIMYAMKGSADRMQEMFQSLFRLTKSADDHRPCGLRDAARHASKLFEVALLRRRIDVETNIPSGIKVDVPFNVAALALANLVGNATHVLDQNGKIRIDARPDGDYVLCEVSDNGKGISPEFRDKIFKPLVSSKKFGSGLGLYLTRHSLSENRSSIELTSTGPTGTVFTIKFPLAKEEARV